MASGEVARAGRWPLVFVAVALLALATLPILQERRIAGLQAEISGVLEPAGRLVHELTLLQARQMAGFQAYLLTGETAFHDRHEDLVGRESEVQAELRALMERAGLEIRGPLAELSSVSQAWHLAHSDAWESDEGRSAYLDDIEEEQERYEAVLGAARRLEEAVQRQVDEGRRTMERERTIQLRLTVGLALLALLATGALVIVGRRLHLLVEEADERRSEALRARRGMAAVLEATGDGVVGLDLEGRCTSLNQTASRLLGYPEVDARGRDAHALLHGKADPEPHPAEECPIRRALRSGVDEQESDDVVWRRDGTSFPARWHLRPLLDGREIRGAVLTVTDMTEIRRAEEALREAVRARDEVVAVVSHDLRNPLGTVIAAAELISEMSLPPAKQWAQVRAIQRAAAHMRRLIEDLLDVARIEEGGLSVNPRPEDPEALVAETMEIFSHKAEDEGLALEADVPEHVPRVLADGDRIVQVLSNLVGNAVKFTERGGRVSVSVEEVEDGVRFSVADTGPGIAADHREHLFDRFWQVEEGDGRGTGLGLTIVRGIVEAHGGTVGVESEVGEGSTFHFVLSRAD